MSASSHGSSPVAFHVSHVRVEVRSDEPAVLAGLRAAWQPASAAPVEITTRVRFETRRVDGGYEVRVDDRMHKQAEHVEDVLPLLEAALYGELRKWHAGLLLLHAACVASARATLLFLGESGAGKSSLTRAAIERGYLYGSDELTVSDGARVWGISRTPQFDVVRRSDPLPRWLAGADVSSYTMRAYGDEGGALPLLGVPEAQVLRAACPVHTVRVVLLAHGSENRARPLDTLHALSALHEASLLGPSPLMSRLLGHGRALALTWADPEMALDRLEALLG